MSKQKTLNTIGTERMCLEHIGNVHKENMRDLENTYQLDRLRENNRADIERRNAEMRFADQNERNKRAMIDTETKAAIDTMNAKTDCEVKIKRVENERLRDKDNFELNMQKERDKFKLDSQNLDYQQEINRKKADTETMRITRELDIKSKDHDEENRRKLIETEGKLKLDTMKVEGNFKKDMAEINNKHEIALKNIQIEEQKMLKEQERESKKLDYDQEINRSNAQLMHEKELNRYKEEQEKI